MEEQVEQVEWKAWSAPPLPAGASPVETNKNSSTSSKSTCRAPLPGRAQVPEAYEGLTAAMAAELMIDFWFGIGAILAIKTVQSLEELMSRK